MKSESPLPKKSSVQQKMKDVLKEVEIKRTGTRGIVTVYNTERKIQQHSSFGKPTT